MTMADYEPASGWNLPAGCFETDLDAPWNQPDPWVGRKCGECTHCATVKLPDGSKINVCAYDPSDVMETIDPSAPAEECFEE